MQYIPLNKPSLQLMYDLINRDNGVEIDETIVSLAEPEVLDSEQADFYDRNSTLLASAAPTSFYYGDQTLFYNRIKLETLFGMTSIGMALEFDDLSDLLNQFNQTFGLAIAPEELESVALDDQQAAVLTIATSYVYEPGDSFKVFSTIPLLRFEEDVDALWEFANYTFPEQLDI